MLKMFGIFLAVVMFFVNGASLVSAEVVRTKLDVEDSNDFVVEPGKTELFLNPGESISKSISITNRLNKRVSFSIYLEDFVGTEDANNPVKLLGDEEGPYSLREFVKPEITEFSLDFGEKITIPIEVTIPQDAEPRGYYGAVVISNKPELEVGGANDTGAEGKTRLISRIGSLFLVRVNGLGQESGKLEEFKVLGPKRLFHGSRPDGFEVIFRNDGNVHLVPYGKITIKNMFGRDVAALPIDAYFALPDSLRYREVSWGDGFGLGRYTANISLYRGYGNQYDEAKIAFWILPWKIILAALAIILAISYLFYFLSHRFELRKK